MTVAELVALLATQDQDAPVATDGCDCIGPAAGVSIVDGWVVIDRVPGESGIR
jgi:hypothetical protein